MLVIVFCQFNTSQGYLQRANEKSTEIMPPSAWPVGKPVGHFPV